MVYALWDMETINLAADYDILRDALALVLEGIERNGPHDTDTLVLEVEDEHGELVSITQGRELAELARQKLQPSPMAG